MKLTPFRDGEDLSYQKSQSCLQISKLNVSPRWDLYSIPCSFRGGGGWRRAASSGFKWWWRLYWGVVLGSGGGWLRGGWSLLNYSYPPKPPDLDISPPFSKSTL